MLTVFRTRRASAHFISLAIIAWALVMRVLIPQGWMPVETSDGWRITICTGSGPMQMDMPGMAAMKAMHHRSGDQDHGSSDHPCAFSGLAMALDKPPLPALPLPTPVPAILLAALVIAIGVGRGLAAPPPPATGPPSLF